MINNKYFIYKNPFKEAEKIIDEINYYGSRYNLEETKNIKEAGVIIAIGGDGTMLEAAKLNLDIPIFGINKGTLGFLTEIEEKRINIAMMDYANDNYHIEKRMMLDHYYYENLKERYSPALNDIVISKKESGIIGLDVIVDGILMTQYLADGIIISTPTGSTGYSLSCGGPIIDPKSEMIIITPIAPHTLTNRSIVVSSSSIIQVKLVRAREDCCANISVDGVREVINEGEIITIHKSKNYTKLIFFNEDSFLEKIRQKMR